MIDQQRFRQLIADRLQVSLDEVIDEADLVADLGGDSLALAELTTELERTLGTSIPADRLYDLETVSDLWNAIQAAAKRSRQA